MTSTRRIALTALATHGTALPLALWLHATVAAWIFGAGLVGSAVWLAIQTIRRPGQES